MEYGLIGEHLGHSFSKNIHGMLSADPYDLVELEREALEPFLKAADFKGINVTIPYKEAVMPFLDSISKPAMAIGAVNTIVNRDGRLFGYNTDYGGLCHCPCHNMPARGPHSRTAGKTRPKGQA